MNILTATIVCFIAVLAQATEPNQCCSPPKWESILFDFNSLDGFPHELIVAHDDSTRMEGVYVKGLGPQPPIMHYVRDFNTMMTYKIMLDPRNPSCSQEPLIDTFFTSCVSFQSLGATDVQHLGVGYTGLSSSTITFDSWSYSIDRKNIQIGLSRDTCFPIYEKVKSVPGSHDQTDAMFLFYNTTTTITSPAILTIPEICRSAAAP